MNATQNFSDSALDVVLKKLPQVTKNNLKIVDVIISIACMVDDPYEIKEYQSVLDFLKNNKIIEQLKNIGRAGYVEDDEFFKHEVYFYEPHFKLNCLALKNFLVSTSRIPEYFIRLYKDGEDISVILNDKYILSKPRYGGPVRNLLDVVYSNPRRKLTRVFIEKTIENTDGVEFRFKRRLDGLLADIGFKKEFKKIFFPAVTQEAIYFRNDVFANEIQSQKINRKILARQFDGLKPFVEIA